MLSLFRALSGRLDVPHRAFTRSRRSCHSRPGHTSSSERCWCLGSNGLQRTVSLFSLEGVRLNVRFGEKCCAAKWRSLQLRENAALALAASAKGGFVRTSAINNSPSERPLHLVRVQSCVFWNVEQCVTIRSLRLLCLTQRFGSTFMVTPKTHLHAH